MDHKAQENFDNRSLRSQHLDMIRLAPFAPNIEVYLKSPNRFDWPGIDHAKNLTEQAKEISDIKATNGDVSLVVKNPEATKQFKVVEKDKAKDETEKELKRAEEQADKTTKNNLPTTEEIYAEAVRLWRKENTKPVHEGFLENVADPTREELKEEGYLNQAKLNLMTSDDTVASRQTLDYVDNVRVELEKIGFTVIPIEGFSSEDLSF